MTDRFHQFSAKVVEDSIGLDGGSRLTTLQLTYPRFIHAEFMTHRVFSRNAASSRAIPVAKMIAQVESDPAMPIHWGKNQPGMQANEQLVGEHLALAHSLWKDAAKKAAHTARLMADAGLHKQVANRILEPFQLMQVIVTATEWDNFFELRDHADAQPEIRALAIKMGDAMRASTPVERTFDLQLATSWHLPYVLPEERASESLLMLIKVSAARCARVSYLTHDGQKPDLAKDLDLYRRLVGSRPLHASPVEHQAAPDTPTHEAPYWSWPEMHGNFKGWVQYRKVLEDSIKQVGHSKRVMNVESA